MSTDSIGMVMCGLRRKSAGDPGSSFCHRIGILLLAVVLTGFAGCCFRDWGYDSSRREFSRRNGAEEARESFARSDYRIYSAMGYAEYFPGLGFNTAFAVKDRFGVICIAGTSDAIEGPAHERFIKAAEVFATAYNQTMVELLEKSGVIDLPKGGDSR